MGIVAPCNLYNSRFLQIRRTKLYAKTLRVCVTNAILFLAWLFQLRLVGFTSHPQQVLQVLAIVLVSSIASFSLLKDHIQDYNGLRKKAIIKQLPFFLTAMVVVCLVLFYGLSDRAYAVIFLPMLEEWFFRGLLLPSLALLDIKLAVLTS